MVWQQVRDATRKGSLSKSPENCPNGIKLYNSKMGRVDLMDHLKSAYQLDRRLKSQFYLCLFFDLLDVAFVNSFIVYKKLENKDRTLKEFKICIALKLIFSFVSRNYLLWAIVHSSAFDVALCLQEERNCFLQYHSLASSNPYS